MVHNKEYYLASPELSLFIRDLDGSYEEFARQSGLSGRTIARMRKGERINRNTANKILKAAFTLGFKQDRENALLEA
ncbi:MAG: hypothetical protein R8K20_07115 [Gallionellaceae bacterium]